MFRLENKAYKLVRIGLVRAACPREVEHTRDNLNLGKAIRIDANVRQLGRVASVGFVPAGIIMAGAARRLKMMEGGFVYDYAFVDREVTDIRCDDEISSNELMQKLDVAIRERILGPARADGNSCFPGQISPWIVEIYPFENYFIYNLKGQKYRQGYVLDPVKREVRLGTGSSKVEEKYVLASGVDVAVKAGGPGSGPRAHAGINTVLERHGFAHTNTNMVQHSLRDKPMRVSYYKKDDDNFARVHQAGDWDHNGETFGRGPVTLDTHLKTMGKPGIKASVDKMPLVQTGVRYSPAVAPGNNQTMTQGASHSELITMLVRNWKNVLDAVENYLAAIRNGQHKPAFRPPMNAPVNLTPAGKIGATIASKGVDVYDFARWSARVQSGELQQSTNKRQY